MRGIPLVAVAFAACAPSVARAQPAQDVARADALFEAAKQLRDAGFYADACPKFEQSEKLAPGIGVMLHLGDCYEHLGRTESAWTEFRKAEELGRQRGDRRADLARARAAALEPKLKSVRTAPSKQALQTVERPVAVAAPSAGSVAAAAAAPLAHDAAAGATSPGVVPAVGGRAEDASAPRDSHPTRSIIELGLAGGGAAAIGVGAAFLAIKNHAIVTGETSSAGDASVAAFAVGGAALVSSVVIYLTAPSDESSALVISPVPMAAGAGAVIRGSF